MNAEQYEVLQSLYGLEEQRLKRNEFDFWLTPAAVAAAVNASPGAARGEDWVRQRLQELWAMRKVLQVCFDHSSPVEMRDVKLDELDCHAPGEERLKLEANDARGADPDGSPWQQVALYPAGADTRYRSRVAEVARMLSFNYQRFNMAPATGLLRYEHRPQLRPLYTWAVEQLAADWSALVRDKGKLRWVRDGDESDLALGADVSRENLGRAIEAVLLALADRLRRPDRPALLADFQVRSISATLCGLYCPDYRKAFDAHVVTAGVGSGKSFAFQIGALIHVAQAALSGRRGIQVLLVYPRVVLAANQFQDLEELVQATAGRLGIELERPVLDAGGQLPAQMGAQDEEIAGKLYRAIQRAYQGNFQILISNLDTLANRLVHPESSAALVRGLDLVVFDEVHILRGIYGAHARMLLARVELLREMWRLRARRPDAPFEGLLGQARPGGPDGPYFVAASATISGPARHTGRILNRRPERVLHLDRGPTEQTGWVHHLFLRQRPETSSATAAVNAVSALIHNRRDGTFREYYQLGPSGGQPIALSDLNNPVQSTGAGAAAAGVGPRDPDRVHKTLGFCDSLDAVGRWADQVADNERTKFAAMGNGPNPAQGDLPYFVRFQEPLWRVVHHLSFAAAPARWQQALWKHYGGLCRDCKKGVRRRIPRVPQGLTAPQQQAVKALWGANPSQGPTYLGELGVKPDLFEAEWFAPLAQAAGEAEVGNLDQCPFHRCGLCWWWSSDHLGSNHPQPARHADPLGGYRQPAPSPEQRYHPVNAIRLRTFTSNTEFDAMQLGSINEVFQDQAARVFRHRGLPEWKQVRENAVFVVGSPRIEVGIDMDRVSDGITFRAMRDPAGLQQKAGRVGRESRSDSVVVHVVTENLRDQFYFRNPRVALDPQYLQAIPLHESNAIVARNHYFMAVVDFLCLQGSGPAAGRVAGGGERLNLVNDFRDRQVNPRNAFARWGEKVRAVWAFLFGNHPRQAHNLANLKRYLQLLGADPDMEAARPGAAAPDPALAPPAEALGAVDVFRHELGEGLMLTPLGVPNFAPTLAEVCCWPRSVPQPMPALAALPRHREFLRQYFEDPAKTVMTRSYLWQLLTLPLFRRGIPRLNVRGDQPYLWVPNLFDAVGNESVRAFLWLADSGREVDKRFETVALAVALLAPGTFTYRYVDDSGPLKVPVNACGAAGLAPLMPRVEAVKLNVADGEFYEPAGCPPVEGDDLPEEFVHTGGALNVFRPRQVGLIPARSSPMATFGGLIADDDEAPSQQGPPLPPVLPTPPRCFALRWYRVGTTRPQAIPCRFQANFCPPPGAGPLPCLPLPPVAKLFTHVHYDPQLQVTDFVWGLDRTFTTRKIEPARLVYRDSAKPAEEAVAIGHHYTAPGLEFGIDLRPGAPLGALLERVLARQDSAAYQSLLWQALHAFLAERALNPLPDGASPWTPRSRPSVFTVQNLKKILALHLLERWHPAPATNERPAGPFRPTLEDLAGCFQPGHPNHVGPERFGRVCQWLARVQNPADVQARADTLLGAYENFTAACGPAGGAPADGAPEGGGAAAGLDVGWLLRTARQVLLNTLGLSIHTAALRQTGAEESDLSYFYRLRPDGTASIYLFDADALGNGTCDVVRENFYVSPAERVLVAKLQAMGLSPDPLPTKDFLVSLEETLQECPNSQSGHLAFHDLPADQEPMADLRGAVAGERRAAGALYDFVRLKVGLGSFDDMVAFQVCPEFLAHLTFPSAAYPLYAPAPGAAAAVGAAAGASPLVGSSHYPTFQSLESATGFCISGCIECVVAPEQNVRGPLAAQVTVNKLLLDAAYRAVVVEADDDRARLAYPGEGPGRTLAWKDVAVAAAAAMARPVPGAAAVQVELPGRPDEPPSRHTILPSAQLGSWDRVFRTSLDPAPVPASRVRLRMSL